MTCQNVKVTAECGPWSVSLDIACSATLASAYVVATYRRDDGSLDVVHRVATHAATIAEAAKKALHAPQWADKIRIENEDSIRVYPGHTWIGLLILLDALLKKSIEGNAKTIRPLCA